MGYFKGLFVIVFWCGEWNFTTNCCLFSCHSFIINWLVISLMAVIFRQVMRYVLGSHNPLLPLILFHSAIIIGNHVFEENSKHVFVWRARTSQLSQIGLAIKSPKYWQLPGAGPALSMPWWLLWTIGSCDKSNFPCQADCRSKYYLHTAVVLFTVKVSPSLLDVILISDC